VTGLLTITLAAAVVVLLTIHRRYGPRLLARAVAEYMVVALLATLLAAPGVGVGDHPPADRTARAEARAQAAAGDDQPALLRAGAKLVRAVTRAANALAGAVRWLADLWRRADPKAKPTQGEAMAASPRSPAPSLLSLWRCL
jgi:hypothetical protein